jgi:ankyrin repeat protein
MIIVTDGQVLLSSTSGGRVADINAQAGKYHNYTALHVAVEQGNADIVELFLHAHASPALRDSHGRTALDLAIMYHDAQPDS